MNIHLDLCIYTAKKEGYQMKLSSLCFEWRMQVINARIAKGHSIQMKIEIRMCLEIEQIFSAV